MLVFLFWEGEQRDKEMPRIKKCLHVIYFWKRKKETNKKPQTQRLYLLIFKNSFLLNQKPLV